jgi:hypothetical protein
VEISRALNALCTTFRDQRPERFDSARADSVLRGALAGEAKLQAAATGATGGSVRRTEDGMMIATVELHDGRWEVTREATAEGSGWAIPQPEHDTQSEDGPPQGGG